VGFPGKTLALYRGRPLAEHAVATATAVAAVDRVLLTTDDERIAALGERSGAVPVRRPPELATATSRTVDAVLHALDVTAVTDLAVVVVLQPTSPLRTPADVAACLDLYARHRTGSVVQVTPLEHHPLKALLRVDGELAPIGDWADLEAPRQSLPAALRPTGAVYVAAAGDIRGSGRLVVPPVRGQEVPTERATDVDTAGDLRAARRWARRHDRSGPGEQDGRQGRSTNSL
jgi:CMP-N-acetylneuraminic acid synthetase